MKHKVEYLIPGSFVSETEVRAIDSRDVQMAVAAAPECAFAFQFYDVEDAPDLGPDFMVVPKAKNRSRKYYIDATVFDLAEVEALGGDHEILASNMRGNGWDRVVRCRTGNWQPLETGDELVTS